MLRRNFSATTFVGAAAASSIAALRFASANSVPFNKSLLGNKGPDANGRREFSVVYTDRSLNHMSDKFLGAMKDLHRSITTAFNARQLVVVPGSGTYAMEAVARQFVPHDGTAMVLRNGLFGHRWIQILEQGPCVATKPVVVSALKSEAKAADKQGGAAAGAAAAIPLCQFQPAPLNTVLERIAATKPKVVFASHVDTSCGVMLPDDYIRQVADAVHAVGGILVLDCIASGMLCPDTKALNVDVVVSAPQKAWTASPCCGLVLLNEGAEALLQSTNSSSFALDLKKWSGIMQNAVGGVPAYHCTMPTDALAGFRDVVVNELEPIGIKELERRQRELGARTRAMMKSKGFVSVAADGFGAPGVVVVHAPTEDFKSGKVFKEQNVQIAPGVPLFLEEGADYKSFRIGLFGLDKLANVDATVDSLSQIFDAVLQKSKV